jgi:muramoyltetrapeptide carboxypeptidase LdcA involved in peptidoglycan recycling
MTIIQQVSIFASRISHWCLCHIKSHSSLEELKIVGTNLAVFVNSIQTEYKILIQPEEFI